MEWVVLFAALLVGAFIHDEGRKRRNEANEINRKLDLLLEKSPAAGEKSSPPNRALAESLGPVQRQFARDEPRVVGTSLETPGDDAEHGVCFLFSTPADAERAREEGLQDRIKEALQKELRERGESGVADSLRVRISSLEAEGIGRDSPGSTANH